jgi:type II secretory pathway pseudopilin PulG
MLRLEVVVRDIRYACRSLARRPGFAVVAVMTLAVGMGTMTVAFSAVNAFFIAGPPIDAPGAGLVAITGGAPEIEGASLREFEAFARDVPALDVSAQTIVTLSRRRDEGAAIVWGLAVTDNYFDTLGVQPAVGRTFNNVNELSALVSHRFWREDLDEASVTGLTLPLNGLDVPIIGVLASDFRAGFYDADVWVRLGDWDALRLPARIRRPDVFQFTVMARLRPQATKAQADSQLQAVASELARAWPATNARRTASFVPFEDAGGSERRALAIVAATAMAMIGIVLLIALFNVVALLLSRAVDREREMTLRGALGASRGRLTQQLVTESLVIATAGGALALFVSRWSNNLLATFAPKAPVPQRIDVTPRLDGRGVHRRPDDRLRHWRRPPACPPGHEPRHRHGDDAADRDRRRPLGQTACDRGVAAGRRRDAPADDGIVAGAERHRHVRGVSRSSIPLTESCSRSIPHPMATPRLPRSSSSPTPWRHSARRLASSAPRSWTGCPSTSASHSGWRSRLTAGCARWRPARPRRAIA